MKSLKLVALKKIKKDVFTLRDAQKAGVSPRMINYLCQNGSIVRLYHGVYAFPEKHKLDFHNLIKEKLAGIPGGIIGLTTALQLYDLTEAAPRSISVIVPENNFSKRKIKDVKIYRVKPELYKIETIKKNGIPVTKLERTIIDLLRTGESLASVIEIINQAKNKRLNVNLPLIRKLSTKFRVKAKVEQLLDALI